MAHREWLIGNRLADIAGYRAVDARRASAGPDLPPHGMHFAVAAREMHLTKPDGHTYTPKKEQSVEESDAFAFAVAWLRAARTQVIR
jgi:hypothetical protein